MGNRINLARAALPLAISPWRFCCIFFILHAAIFVQKRQHIFNGGPKLFRPERLVPPRSVYLHISKVLVSTQPG